MTDKPRPHWFRFRLWQVFALTTVLCVYLGWQVGIVRSRAAFIKELRADGVQVTTVSQLETNYLAILAARERPAAIPFTRRLLGDEAVQYIGYYSPPGIGAERVAQIRRTFPEAVVTQHERPLEPCHPGCFPHGTLVETPDGPRLIEAIAVGERVYMISDTGEKKSVAIQSIFRTHNRLWEVSTDRGVLVTTETQPLCTSLRVHVAAGKLQPGDQILVWSEEQVQPVTVEQVARTERIVPVINLVLGNREPFIANGYLARSKPPADEIADGRAEIAD